MFNSNKIEGRTFIWSRRLFETTGSDLVSRSSVIYLWKKKDGVRM